MYARFSGSDGTRGASHICMGQKYGHHCNVLFRGDDYGIPSRDNATRDVKPQRGGDGRRVDNVHKDIEVWW